MNWVSLAKKPTRYAARSQALFDAAVRDGFQAGEILPIEVPSGTQAAAEDRRPSTSIRVQKATSKRCRACDHCLTAALSLQATPRASTMARLRY